MFHKQLNIGEYWTPPPLITNESVIIEGPGQGHFPTDKESRNRKKKKEVTAGFKLTTPSLTTAL